MTDVSEKIFEIKSKLINKNNHLNSIKTKPTLGIMRIDLGCGKHKPDNFLGVDIQARPGVDIVADLTQEFPFQDSSVDEVRAYDVIEHLPDRIHTMNEIWRVCKPGAKVDIRVPSTDGRGAFQDPTHVSFWNINSFFYYCVDFPAYLELCKSYGFRGEFKLVSLEHEESPAQVIHVRAELLVVKSEISLVTDFSSSTVKSTPFQERASEQISPASIQENFNLTALSSQIDQCKKNSTPDTLNNLRQARQQIANQWLEWPADKLESVYLSNVGQAHNLLLHSSIRHEFLTNTEKTFIDKLLAGISKGLAEQQAINYLLSAMLYCRADKLPLPNDLTKIPRWLLKDYLKFVLSAPRRFQAVGEADQYYHYMQRWIDYLHSNIVGHINTSFWKDVALIFLENASFLQVYFNEANLKNIYVKRAEIVEYFLRSNGHEIDYEFSVGSLNRKKLRLGILATHFIPSAETFASLPIYEYISRDFEVILYSFNITGHPLEQYCQSCANAFRLLPNNLTDQVDFIRGDDLDILFIATNVTIGTNSICLLALHRLARIQVTSVASVVTTGIRNIDYYISGKLTDPSDDAEQHYLEKLLKIEGTAHCFSYGSEQDTAQIEVERESLGISREAVVFISGANLFKILPELLHTWSKIIAAVPKSVLVLYPWGPNWSDNYPKQSFTRNLNEIFAQQGVESDRLIILDPDPVPNRDDIKEYLKLADIYLDSHPFSGTTSIIDPLEVGLPVVARQGTCFRSSMGAALLQELAMPDLVANNEESYIQLAIALGTNPELRQQKSEQIQQKMRKKPKFLDSRSYSAQIGSLFQELFQKYLADALERELRLRDINLIIFPDWSQPEDSLLQNLASAIRELVTHPDKSQMTLLVDTRNITDEEADLAVSSVVMNLLMEEDLDVSEGVEISLVGKLGERQWEALLTRIHSRIVLENENKQAIADLGAHNIPICEINHFSSKRVVHLTNGSWSFQEALSD